MPAEREEVNIRVAYGDNEDLRTRAMAVGRDGPGSADGPGRAEE